VKCVACVKCKMCDNKIYRTVAACEVVMGSKPVNLLLQYSDPMRIVELCHYAGIILSIIDGNLMHIIRQIAQNPTSCAPFL